MQYVHRGRILYTSNTDENNSEEEVFSDKNMDYSSESEDNEPMDGQPSLNTILKQMNQTLMTVDKNQLSMKKSLKGMNSQIEKLKNINLNVNVNMNV